MSADSQLLRALSVGSEALVRDPEDDCVTLATAAAKGGGTDASSSSAQGMRERQDQPCTGCADWVPERNRPSIAVDSGGIHIQLAD